MRLATILITAAATAALASCGSAADEPTPATSPATTSAEQADAAQGEECVAEDFTVAGDKGQAPDVTVPDDCSAPTELLIEDVEAGSGAEVTAGDTAEVHYQLVGFSDGGKLDSSWERGESFPVENVGNAPVIDGWNEGLIGMKEGARRLLVVPPELGYGASPGHQLAEETLVFVVDLKKVS
ncbi:FKBP-type peptidyl-prolyl cis-trans isomerase [Haloechinothrix salitolerans]|uniref:Peptidyl-prolyl cis-trans isomerase n=1 Tax=Haloechinothrix salitolerans TaxID=926830 RepID=A0ABW2C8G0_9PSEU